MKEQALNNNSNMSLKVFDHENFFPPPTGVLSFLYKYNLYHTGGFTSTVAVVLSISRLFWLFYVGAHGT